MITEAEKRIIDAFDILFKESSRDKKIQLYKIINSDLESCQPEVDNFSIKNYLKQFLFDLTNHNSYELNLEIFRAFQLLLEKTLKRRMRLSVGAENQILTKILESSRKNKQFFGMEFINDKTFLTIACTILSDKRIPNEIITAYENEIYEIITRVFEIKLEELYHMSINLLIKHLKLIANKENTDTATQIQLNQDEELKVGLWFKHLLDLIFSTNDEKLRTLLISAFELYSVLVVDLHYRKMSFWPDVKGAIFDKYTTKLHELRNTTTEWYKIWTILSQIVSLEILKSASIINKFLSIVEIGFRGEDLRIRAQAYLCWRSLIEIFGRDNELNVAKRIRLVCIPLKPARPKSQDIAINKFKAWWCLITKLNQAVTEHIPNILLPFLEFCFGRATSVPLESYFETEAPNKITSIAKIYTQPSSNVRNMAIFAFAQLLVHNQEDLKTFQALVKNEVDLIPQPIDFSKDIKVIAGPLINYCGEVTVLISHNGPQANKLCEILWMNLLNFIESQSTFEYFDLIIKNIHGLVRVVSNRQVIEIL